MRRRLCGLFRIHLAIDLGFEGVNGGAGCGQVNLQLFYCGFQRVYVALQLGADLFQLGQGVIDIIHLLIDSGDGVCLSVVMIDDTNHTKDDGDDYAHREDGQPYFVVISLFLCCLRNTNLRLWILLIYFMPIGCFSRILAILLNRGTPV